MRQLGHKRAQQCTCLLQRGSARRSSLVHGKYFSRLPLQVASTLHSSESSVSNFQKILTNLAWYQRYLVSVGIRDFFMFQNSWESSLVFKVNFCVLVQDTCWETSAFYFYDRGVRNSFRFFQPTKNFSTEYPSQKGWNPKTSFLAPRQTKSPRGQTSTEADNVVDQDCCDGNRPRTREVATPARHSVIRLTCANAYRTATRHPLMRLRTHMRTPRTAQLIAAGNSCSAKMWAVLRGRA